LRSIENKCIQKFSYFEGLGKIKMGRFVIRSLTIWYSCLREMKNEFNTSMPTYKFIATSIACVVATTIGNSFVIVTN